MRFLLAALAACSFALLLAAPAQADVEWLCRPGAEDNPCVGSLETTVYDSEGNSRVENPPLARHAPIDCFYVYPTVSEQPGANANKDKDPEIRAIAKYQAARWSQLCDVYAPMYRQQTLLGVARGGNADALKLAYGDVLEAWRDYLANHNRGRGVVLMGHSQGTRMLRRLVREEVDPSEAQRRLLVSAVLPGANVTVRRGQTAGGDFQHVAACTRSGQIGCVMAWSTFNETPPANSRFGRVPDEDTSGFDLPVGPDYEVLCTNPASLGANERTPLSTLMPSEPFPGVIGLLLTETYGGSQPTAPTPWLQPQDHYTGKCETRDGANVLMLEPVGNARKLNAAPDPSWGLHLTDANIALGDEIAAVSRQVTSYRRAHPRLRLAVRCRRVTLRGPDLPLVRSVRFKRGRHTLKTDRRAPFGVTLGRKVKRVRARVALGGSAHATLARRVRICRGA